ncbi:MAG: CDP-diacylglycerol--serine O-phosphatidyltransferase [Pseudomonadota bacterium]
MAEDPLDEVIEAGPTAENERGARRLALRRALPARALVPNLLTILALSAGLTAIRFAMQGRFELAVTLILLAALLDGLDGRVARYMKGVSKLGAEMDSLADIVNFGVAPALMLYTWALQDMRSPGWIAVLIYVVCCLLRLARFNVMNREEEDAPDAKRFFVGVPAPAGAGLVLLPMFLYLAGWEGIKELGPLIIAHLVIVGLLMVSRVPTFSFKKLLVPTDSIAFVLIGAVIIIAILFTYPWYSMVAITIAYMASIIISWRTARTVKQDG